MRTHERKRPPKALHVPSAPPNVFGGLADLELTAAADVYPGRS